MSLVCRVVAKITKFQELINGSTSDYYTHTLTIPMNLLGQSATVQRSSARKGVTLTQAMFLRQLYLLATVLTGPRTASFQELRGCTWYSLCFQGCNGEPLRKPRDLQVNPPAPTLTPGTRTRGPSALK